MFYGKAKKQKYDRTWTDGMSSNGMVVQFILFDGANFGYCPYAFVCVCVCVCVCRYARACMQIKSSVCFLPITAYLEPSDFCQVVFHQSIFHPLLVDAVPVSHYRVNTW